MSKEIERKFLVKNDSFLQSITPEEYHQGYLSVDPERVVRVRIEANTAKLTIKGKNKGCVRDEYEYPIPLTDAQYMLENLCLQPTIQKKRYKILFQNFLWEIDCFEGANRGLIVAEIELPSAETYFPLPEWVDKEVTGDLRYYNSSLIKNPFITW